LLLKKHTHPEVMHAMAVHFRAPKLPVRLFPLAPHAQPSKPMHQSRGIRLGEKLQRGMTNTSTPQTPITKK
jgi:hypothetical protein